MILCDGCGKSFETLLPFVFEKEKGHFCKKCFYEKTDQFFIVKNLKAQLKRCGGKIDKEKISQTKQKIGQSKGKVVRNYLGVSAAEKIELDAEKRSLIEVAEWRERLAPKVVNRRMVYKRFKDKPGLYEIKKKIEVALNS